MLLEQIKQENDIKKIKKEDYPRLAQEIRDFLVEKISMTGGHLASNLGAVELTMALHLSFDLPKDKIVWDVGHQSYVHKMLTGRQEGFDQLRKFGGMSGFPKRKESECDCFDTGHSSTSISAGLGLAKARDLAGDDSYIVSVIGDGALTGGMAFEALNNAGRMDTNFIIILNDNNMSISENVGGMSRYLGGIRTSETYLGLRDNIYYSINSIPVYGEKVVDKVRKTKNSIKQLFVPGMLFEQMGITYLGPIDGHNIQEMQKALKEAKRVHKAVMVHVITQKGRGYKPAEQHPSRFHGTDPFVIESGEPKNKAAKPTWTDCFSMIMKKLGEKEPSLVAITAAMADGTGLKRFASLYPDRFFDVGIAEQHAVTFAAGLAAGGMKPVFAVYSSFLQRAYDQIVHDVCLQNLPVIFAVDRAGLVGSDGETHQGIFDLSYLSHIPNMTVMAPKNKWELGAMMRFAVDYSGPIAIRYPRGEAFDGLEEFRAPVTPGRSEVIYDESEIAILAVGNMVEIGLDARRRIKECGYQCSLINARFVQPMDTEMIRKAAAEHKVLVTLEENVHSGGFGQQVADYVRENCLDVRVVVCAIPDEYVEHGSVSILRHEEGIDAESVTRRVIAAYAGL